jgi:hypothetical protein
MTETKEKLSNNFSTYFDRDAVLRMVRVTRIASWIVGGLYGVQLLTNLTIFVLQYVRGLLYLGGVSDFVQQILWQVQPSMAGLIFFVALQAIALVLLMLLDIEDNTRRAARK